MTVFLYRKYPPSHFSKAEKYASSYRQGLYQIPVMILCLFAVLVASTVGDKMTVDNLRIFETNLTLKLSMVFLTICAFLGQILTIREILIYRIYRASFRQLGVEIQKPINLLSALIIPVLFLGLSSGLLQYLL